MIIFLLIVIAVLLFVLASKFAPDELGQLVPVVIFIGVICLLAQYWQFILAVPFIAFYGLQAFSETELFESIVLLIGGGMLIWAAYVFANKVLSELKSKEGRAQWKAGAKDGLKIAGKVGLYSVLGIVGFVVLILILALIFQ